MKKKPDSCYYMITRESKFRIEKIQIISILKHMTVPRRSQVSMVQEEIDYRRIEKSLEYISGNYISQPSLNEIAEYVHISPFHFQRLFIRWAGVSPKKFLQYVTIENSKKKLERSKNLSEVAFDVGLSGSSRLHDLYMNFEGMTPYQYKLKGSGIKIYYDYYYGPFGRFLIAVTDKNRICSIQFVDEGVDGEVLLKQEWYNSEVIHSRAKTKDYAHNIFKLDSWTHFDILTMGTSFQIKVWEALLKVPFGWLVSYQDIAKSINNPKAVQAVGSAVGRNPIAYLIPCHRVIRKTGLINQYKWGETRKKAIIGWEFSNE